MKQHVNNLDFLFANEALAELLEGNEVLQMTLAENIAHGASQQSITDLCCALLACDYAPEDDEETIQKVFYVLNRVKRECGGRSFPEVERGMLQ